MGDKLLGLLQAARGGGGKAQPARIVHGNAGRVSTLKRQAQLRAQYAASAHLRVRRVEHTCSVLIERKVEDGHAHT